MKQYKVTPGFLEEMPRMEKPNPGQYSHPLDTNGFWINGLKRYSEHLRSLQRIPIAQGVKFEGEIINEDQFEVRDEESCPHNCEHGDPDCSRKFGICNPKEYAYPKQPEGKGLRAGYANEENLFTLALHNDWSAKKAISYILENFDLTPKRLPPTKNKPQ